MGMINNFVGRNGILRHNHAYSKIPFEHRDGITLKTNQVIFVGFSDIANKLAMNDRILERQIKQANVRQFDISDDKLADLSSYVENDVPSAYASFYKKKLISHIAEYHRSDSLVTQVNDDYLNISCDSLGVDLTKTDFININTVDEVATSEVSGDFVTSIATHEDSSTALTAVEAYVSNSKTGHTYAKSINDHRPLDGATLKSLDVIPFTCKNWASGIKELCIFIPTTFTFYKGGVTSLKLLIDNAFFKFQHVFYVDICAQSLPLQISKDSTQVFNSIIGQSVVVNTNLDEFQMHRSSLVYNFKCIGSDAQAVRIIGY